MLSKRKRYDYHDIDRGELKLIRIGHAIWLLRKKELAKKGSTGVEIQAFDEALETIWELKRQYRAELAIKRAEKWAKAKHKFAKRLPARPYEWRWK